MPSRPKWNGIKVKSMAFTPSMLERDMAIKVTAKTIFSLPNRNRQAIAAALIKK